jgi:eukaryotic-like serine/threonine-protein kinase
VVYTASPGWRAQIWARGTPPNRNSFDTGPRGWTRLTQVAHLASKQNIPLNTGGTRYRYYLVWATGLPPGKQSVSINEIALYYLTKGS